MKKQLVIFLFIFAVQIDIGKLQVTFPDETGLVECFVDLLNFFNI